MLVLNCLYFCVLIEASIFCFKTTAKLFKKINVRGFKTLAEGVLGQWEEV